MKKTITKYTLATSFLLFCFIQTNAQSLLMPQVTYTASSGPVKAAMADFNGDGKQDIAVANNSGNTPGNSVSVFLNMGSGTFSTQVIYAAGYEPQTISAGDLNGDGKPDLVVPNNGNYISVLLNTGSGTFSAPLSYTVGNAPSGASIADVNGDGQPDIVVVNSNSNTISVLLNAGSGTFASQVTYPGGFNPYGISMADFNGDARPDIVVANASNNTISVLLTTGLSTTGIEHLAALPGLMVYPNPTNGAFTVELDNGVEKNIQVMDITGRIVFAAATSDDKTSINISTLANGSYYVQIQSNNAAEVLKIVKR